MPTVREIVTEYLKANGYDGLYGFECGCAIDDLFPCGEPCLSCSPGYLNNCETCICVTQRKTTAYECPYDLADEDNRTVTTATKCWKGA